MQGRLLLMFNKMKEGKLKTPEWILKGYKSKEEWERKKGIGDKKIKEKKYKIKICPKCGNTKISVILGGEEGKGSKGWECRKCKWQGQNPGEKGLDEDEFLAHLENINEE